MGEEETIAVSKRKIIKFSNYSLCVTLPKKIVDEMSLSKGDLVEISIDKNKNGIIIKKNQEHKNTENESSKSSRW